MKKYLFNTLMAFALFLAPDISFGQAPNLGTAANFVLFTGTGAVTNTGTSHLTGNVGTNSGSSTGFGNVDGAMHDNDGVSGAASSDLLTAYGQLNAATPTFFPSVLLGNGAIFVPGVYQVSGNATLNGLLILDGQGTANSVFIIQVQGTLSTNTLSSVLLINGAKACNVFWKVEGLVSMASNSTMRGTIVAHNAAIAMNANDTLEGRALSTVGAITLNSINAAIPLGCAAVLTGPAAPTLASIACYGIFSANGPVTNVGVTHVTGDIGTNGGLTTGYDPLLVTGTIHPIPDASTATCATDLQSVYNYLNTLPYDIELLYPAQFGNDLVLTPHTYIMNAATTFTGNLYLNAEGNANAVFTILINGAVSTSTFSKVILMNGAQAKNVFWKVEGAVSINDFSLFNGTVICNNGAINLATGDTINGRLLSTTGAVSTSAILLTITAGCGPVCAVGAITGQMHVCPGATTTLIDTPAGGKWSSSNTAIATIDSVSGNVTGISGGTVNIMYTLPAGCFAITTFTVYDAPAAITGITQVCPGATTTLNNTDIGGLYSSSNTALATVGNISGIVTGVAAGAPVITYTAPTGCTTATIVTVNPLPNSGTISGASTVCIGASTTLTDNVAGGAWNITNAFATVNNGVVTGVTTGIDTILYSVTNSCGTATAAKAVTVNPLPNSGTITGASTVCAGSSITLTDNAGGGAWNVTNAIATVNNGIVTGNAAGVDTILYSVTNSCGTATATQAITVNAMPSVVVPVNQTLCNGATAAYTFLSNTGGTSYSWANDNTSIGLGASGTGNIALFTATNSANNAELANIHVTPVANGCTGLTQNFTITVNPVPNAIALPNLVFCTGEATAIINFSGSVTGTTYSWINNQSSIGLAGGGTGNIPSFTTANNTSIPITATVMVTPSANGCDGTAQSFTIIVNPTPTVDLLTDQTVCNGNPVNAVSFNGPVAGTTYSWMNDNTSIGLAASGTGSIGTFTAANNTNAPITATISVTPSANGCTALPVVFTITVNLNPDAPIIALTTPSTLCDSTFFRNFGAATLPPAGISYTWSGVNATISDTGSTRQYALVNFKTVGDATVILTSTITNTGCLNSVSYHVAVGEEVADIPAQVIYFNSMFICLQNTEGAYQWGYDDASTLAPTTLTGEINQDYDNANPAFTTNNYWVMVSHNGCIQKTYYNKPANAVMVLQQTIVTVSPNPATSNIQVIINTTVAGNMQMEIMNMLGQKKLVSAITNNKAQVDVSGFTPGVYLINCYRDGVRISVTQFIKN